MQMEEKSRCKIQGAVNTANLGWGGIAQDHVHYDQGSTFERFNASDRGVTAPLSLRSSFFSLQEEGLTRSREERAATLEHTGTAKQVASTPIVARPSPTPTVLGTLSEKQYLEDWVNSFEAEQTTFDSLAEYCELKLQEAIHVSRQLGTPNAFRTAVASALLCKVCSRFGRYENVLAMLKKEVFESVYKESEKLFESGGEVGVRLLRSSGFGTLLLRH